MQGVTAVVHLAAAMEWLDFLKDQVPANVIAIYHLFEAAKRHNVPRVILASSVMVGSIHRGDKSRLRGPWEVTWPHNTYGATKVFAEEMGKVYSHQAKTCVIAARICWLPRNPDTMREIRKRNAFGGFTSHDDAGRFFLKAVDAEHETLIPGSFHVLYVVGKPPEGTSPWVDFAPARELIGFEPQDSYPNGMPAEWGKDF